MKYVKLTAKPNTWFKEGTEVMWEDDEYINRRPTFKEWCGITASEFPYALFRGLRIVENPMSEGKCFEVGEEHDGDGEMCSCDEFDIELVDEDFRKYN